MMRYYKIVENGLIREIGTGLGGVEITEEEYNAISNMMDNKPPAPEGKICRITEAGEYVFVNAPPEPVDEDPELTSDEALAIITGGDMG